MAFSWRSLCAKLCRLGLVTWTAGLCQACASTTYNFEPGGAGGEVKSSLHISHLDEGKYLGEISPSQLRKRCGDKGLKDVSVSYGIIGVMLRLVIRSGLDVMDMEYRCAYHAHKKSAS